MPSADCLAAVVPFPDCLGSCEAHARSHTPPGRSARLGVSPAVTPRPIDAVLSVKLSTEGLVVAGELPIDPLVFLVLKRCDEYRIWNTDNFAENCTWMRKPDRRYGFNLSGLIYLGLILAAVGAVIAAMGVSVLVGAARGGLGLGIFGVAFSFYFFSLAGSAFLRYRHFKKHPQLGRGLDFPPLLVDLDQPYRLRLLYIGIAAATGGGTAVYAGGSILEGSKPYSSALGTILMIIALICFAIAARFFWKYYKKCSERIR